MRAHATRLRDFFAREDMYDDKPWGHATRLLLPRYFYAKLSEVALHSSHTEASIAFSVLRELITFCAGWSYQNACLLLSAVAYRWLKRFVPLIECELVEGDLEMDVQGEIVATTHYWLRIASVDVDIGTLVNKCTATSAPKTRVSKVVVKQPFPKLLQTGSAGTRLETTDDEKQQVLAMSRAYEVFCKNITTFFLEAPRIWTAWCPKREPRSKKCKTCSHHFTELRMRECAACREGNGALVQ